jgi:hypothetical protein
LSTVDDFDATEGSDGPIPSQEEQTAAAKQLTERKKSSRAEVDHDDPALGRNEEDASGLAGLGAFHAIRSIAPFLTLSQLYSEAFYARRKSPRARFDAFAVDHKWLVRASYLLDLLVRLVLVAVILAVIVKGVAPFENPFPRGTNLPASTPSSEG